MVEVDGVTEKLKEYWLWKVKCDASCLRDAPVLKNRDFILAAIERNGLALEFASEEFSRDRDIVLDAVEQNGLALEYATKKLQGDRDVVLAAVEQNGLALEYATKKLQRDRDIVLAAVAKHGQALEYAAKELQGDRDVVLAAVEQNGLALEHATKKLQGDRDVVLTAVQQHVSAWHCAAVELRRDRDIFFAAVQQNEWLLYQTPKELQRDKEIVLAAVQHDGMLLQFASKELQGDWDVALAAVDEDEKAFKHVSKDLQGDPAFVLAAVKKNGNVLKYTSEEMWGDIQIALAAVQEMVSELKERKAAKQRAAVNHGNARISFGTVKTRRPCKWARRCVEDLQKLLELLPVSILCDEKCIIQLKSKWGESVLYSWARDQTKADLLRCLVEVDNSIAYLRYRPGDRPIDRAIPLCREAMHSALYLLVKFDLCTNLPLLHTSRTSVVFKGNEREKTHALVFKSLRYHEQALAELKGRKNLASDLIVSLKQLYVVSSIDDCKYEELKNACPGVPVVRDKNLARSVSRVISKKSLQVPGHDDEKYKDNGYSYVLVLEGGDRTLDDALSQDRIVGQSSVAKHIVTGIAHACCDLHKNSRIHGDLNPKNIVLFGNTPKLIDLDVSCEVGSPRGKKAPSTGFCAPEVARARNNLESLNGSIAHDLFSFGAIMFLIEANRPLWNTDRDGDVVNEEMESLMNWNMSTFHKKLKGTNCSEEAKDLMRKLLEPNPERRIEHFANDGVCEMEMVLKEPYFTTMLEATRKRKRNEDNSDVEKAK